VIAHPDFKGKSPAGEFGDSLREHDHNVGRILDALKDAGVADNTRTTARSTAWTNSTLLRADRRSPIASTSCCSWVRSSWLSSGGATRFTSMASTASMGRSRIGPFRGPSTWRPIPRSAGTSSGSTWLTEELGPVIAAYQASVKKYPNLAAGQPDDKPPRYGKEDPTAETGADGVDRKFGTLKGH
jgi:hypothetical protein